MRALKVKITKAHSSKLWYSEFIGQTVYVEEHASCHSPVYGNIPAYTRIDFVDGRIERSDYILLEGDFEILSRVNLSVKTVLDETPATITKYKVLYSTTMTTMVDDGEEDYNEISLSDQYYASLEEFKQKNEEYRVPLYLVEESAKEFLDN